MQPKTVIISLATLASITGLALALQNVANYRDYPKPPPPPAEKAVATEIPPAIPPEMMRAPVQCPDPLGSIYLGFGDEITEEVREAVHAFEDANYDPTLVEPEIDRAVSYIDLNNDGRKDVLALYQGKNWCGMNNCLVEAYIQNENGGYKASQAFYGKRGTVMVMDAYKNGFRQILTPVNKGAIGQEYNLWEWDGEKYHSDRTCYM